MAMWTRRLVLAAAAAGLSVVGCDTTSPDEPVPPPDEQPEDDPADEQPSDEQPSDDGPSDDEPSDEPPGDDPAVDDDLSPDPSPRHAVELTSWVDEAPANLNHRIEGTVTDDSGQGEFGVPVRFEVHRDDTLVIAVDRQSEADGEVLFSYNAGARPGDTDVVVACALDQRRADAGDAEAGSDGTDASSPLCTDEDGGGLDQPTDDPAEGQVAGSATVTWGDERRVDPDPDGSDFFGEAIVIDPDGQVLEVQLLPRAADLGAFVAFDYTDDADYEVDGEPVTMEAFACAVERTVADDAAEQRVTISLTPPEVMRYLLTSSTDVDGCL
jgi:hypothetical protein